MTYNGWYAIKPNQSLLCSIILPFPKKGNHRIIKNYRGITLTSIATNVYNVVLFNYIEPEIEKILWKNLNGFWRNLSTTSQVLTIHQIIAGVNAKNLQAKLLFADLSKAFDSIYGGTIEQKLLAHYLCKETITIMICTL